MGKKYKYTLININLPQGPVKSTTSLSYRRQDNLHSTYTTKIQQHISFLFFKFFIFNCKLKIMKLQAINAIVYMLLSDVYSL